MVSTLDFESNNPSSILGMSFFKFIYFKINRNNHHQKFYLIKTEEKPIIVFQNMYKFQLQFLYYKSTVTSLYFKFQMIQSFCPSTLTIDFNNQKNRKIALEFELKMLQLYGPTLGIYALPNVENQNIWNGIIFIRSGYYKDGKFKFTLKLQDFPTSQPKLYFLSKIFHPLINESTLELDVSSTLSDMWNYSTENMLYNLMKDIKKMFTDKHRLTNRFSFNWAAAELYQTNTHQFITKAMESVNDSLDKINQNEENCSLKITQQTQDSLEIKSLLKEVVIMDGLKTSEKVQIFLKKLLQ